MKLTDETSLILPNYKIDKSLRSTELHEAMEDVRLGRNLHGSYSSGEEAVRSMMED